MSAREFRGSARMKSFLTYVVTETLEGRSTEIRAKTIAMDVYGYSADDLSKREGVVRVDAGRVRRKLDAYYKGAGASDPVVISLPVGSYAPVFTSGIETAPNSQHAKRRILAGLGIGLIILGLVLASVFIRNARNDGLSNTGTTIYDVAPARVEAINLCRAGRDLIFPVVTLARLQPALLIFETAIDRDPLYFGGYAGAAQVETMLAILQFNDPVSAELLSKADANSEHALELAPDAPWALSARAWLEFGLGNHDRAVSLSERAVDMAPNDPHIAEFDALILLYTLNFERILSQSAHYEELAKTSRGLVFDNALGAAQFHTGEYETAIRTYEKTIARGGPFGPISAAYLMAAHWNNGEHAEARQIAKTFEQTWPGFPLKALKSRVFASPEPVEALTTAMESAGWTGPGTN